MRKRIGLLTVLLAMAMPLGVAWAQEEKEKKESDLAARVEKLEAALKAQKAPSPFTVGGTIFGFYAYSRDGVDGKDYNRFDLERSYITVQGPLSDTWKVRMTADLYRGQDTYKGFGVRMKFAYVDYTPGPISVKLGIIPGPFNGVEESSWKYRVVSKTPSDRYGYLPTADLGASVTYAFPDKVGELAAYLINGKGYDAPEADKFKDVVLRANVTPFTSSPLLKGVTLAGYYYNGYEKSSRNQGLPKRRLGAMLGYTVEFASIGCIYNGRTDAPSNPDTTQTGNVVSIFGELKFPWEELKQFSLIGRWDNIEPSSAAANDKTTLVIAGLTYKANDKVTMALDYQALYGEAATTLRKTAGGTAGYDGRFYLHMVVNF